MRKILGWILTTDVVVLAGCFLIWVLLHLALVGLVLLLGHFAIRADFQNAFVAFILVVALASALAALKAAILR